MSYYGINFEQSINFVRRRYYYLHKSENSYQEYLFIPSDYIRKDLELSDFIKEVKE